LFAGCGPAVKQQPQPQAVGGLEVVMAANRRKTLTLVTAAGADGRFEQTPIHAKLAAYVGEVLVDYGDQVKQGQPWSSHCRGRCQVAQKQAMRTGPRNWCAGGGCQGSRRWRGDGHGLGASDPGWYRSHAGRHRSLEIGIRPDRTARGQRLVNRQLWTKRSRIPCG
jgi:hypothetical protein